MIGTMQSSNNATTSDIFRAWLVATSVLCGGLVMTLEVLGSRVIGPLFGASLFVWTSLIAVTLLALAVGYALGGRLADRSDGSPDLLYGLIALSGIATLAVPFMRGAVLEACVPLGIRLGAFTSAFVLFAPPLLLLGMVSPFIVRLATRELRSVGWTVGLFSALSTGGSVVGTIATGFFLVPRFGVTSIFTASGLILLALAAGWFGVARRRLAAMVLLLPLPMLLREEPLVSKVQENGTSATVVVKRESAYGQLKVIDYSYGESRTRELMIDGLVQGGIDLGSGLSIYEYPYFMSRLARAKNPTGTRALAIGLGAGVVPTWFEERGVRCDVIEIDPEIVRLAREQFAFHASGVIHVEDARASLARLDGQWDYVLLDVFGGDTTPGHLLSREALALVEPRLAPGAVLAANLITELAPAPWVLASVVRTMQTVFDVVEIHPTFDPSASGPGFGNVVVIAYDGPRREIVRDDLLREPAHGLTRELVHANLGREWTLPPEAPGTILTDEFNPIDFFDRRTRERVRAQIIAGTDFDILL